MSEYNAKDTYRAIVFYNSIIKASYLVSSGTTQRYPIEEKYYYFAVAGDTFGWLHYLTSFSVSDEKSLHPYIKTSQIFSYVGSEKFIVNAMCASHNLVFSDSINLHKFSSTVLATTAPIRFFQKCVGSIFKQTELPVITYSDTLSPLLGYDASKWAILSTTELFVQLLNGWEFSQQKHSAHMMHYIVKVQTGGTNSEAKLIFRMFPVVKPYSLSSWQTSGSSAYSEFSYLRIYNGVLYSSDSNSLSDEQALDAHSWGYKFSGFSSLGRETAIWADARRRLIDTSDTDAICMVLKDATHLVTYSFAYPFLPATLHEFEFSQNFKQCTYFYGKYILLGEDMLVYYLMPDGTLSVVTDTEIDPSEMVLLVSHPDQDILYVLGGSKQIIIDRDFNKVVVESAWSGLAEGLKYTNFDCDGNVWVGAQRRNKTTLAVMNEIPSGGICNFTYFAGSDSVAYDLDGNVLNNVPVQFISSPQQSNIIWKYPQAVTVPYCKEDFARLSNAETWYGRSTADGTIQEYNGTNAIPISQDPVTGKYVALLSDGVQIVFDDAGGEKTLHQNDYIYFTVARGVVKDALNKAEIRVHMDMLDYYKCVTEFTISSAINYIPEKNHYDFWDMSTTVFDCRYVTESGNIPLTIITTGSPTIGQALIASNGAITFNIADVGRIVEIEYYVAKDPYVS